MTEKEARRYAKVIEKHRGKESFQAEAIHSPVPNHPDYWTVETYNITEDRTVILKTKYDVKMFYSRHAIRGRR